MTSHHAVMLTRSCLRCHGNRSGFVGVPKVKRDKFSVFNFLTVAESREAPGEFSGLQTGGAAAALTPSSLLFRGWEEVALGRLRAAEEGGHSE